MRKRLAVVVLSLILCAALQPAPAANDVDALAACYAEDAILWGPGAPPAQGRDAIRAAWGGMLEANTITGVVFTDTHYETVGVTSLGYGNFKLTMQPKAGGDPIVMEGRYSVVAKKEDGRWVYVMDHVSTHPPPPEE